MSVRFDNSSIPAKENILSNEKVPILRLQSQQHVTPKTSIADFGRTTPRKSRSNSRSNSKSTELLRPIHNLRMSRYFRQARPNASVYSPVSFVFGEYSNKNMCRPHRDLMQHRSLLS